MDLLSLLVPLFYAICGLLPLGLVPSIRAHGGKPGSTGLLVALAGLAVWGLGLAWLAVAVQWISAYFALLSAITLTTFGSQFSAAGYVLLAGEYTGRIDVTRRRLAGVIGLVVLAQLLSITDSVHGLVWNGSSRPLLGQDALGPLGVGLMRLTLVISLIALALLLVDSVTAHGVRRKQSLALSLAGGSTIAFYGIDIAIETGIPFPIFPVGFVVSGYVYAWALFRADFLDVVPVARKRIVEEMNDAAVIIDGDSRVVECNPAARELVGVDRNYAGMPIKDFFRSSPEMVDRFENATGVDTEITVTSDGTARHYHLSISRIDDSGAVGTDPGRLIVLRDITTLKQREAELEFLKQVQGRVLRHNIRNDLTVIRGYAELLVESGNDRSAPLARAITEKSDELLALSHKARTIEQVIDRDGSTSSIDLSATLTDLVESRRAIYPHASIETSVPDQCVVETDRWLEVAFEIILENAVEHNDDPQPTVDVALERTEGAAIVTIADDGPGIPSDELAVLERGEETQLKHGSGMGLWIVHWVVEHSAASIDFETGDDGTSVSIRIPT